MGPTLVTLNSLMYREILQFLLNLFFKFLGVGFKGFGEFEDEISYRRKLNSKIQKEKCEGLPLFDGSIQSVQWE